VSFFDSIEESSLFSGLWIPRSSWSMTKTEFIHRDLVVQTQNRTLVFRMIIKSIIYRAAINLLRVFWRLIGGRRISAFGHEIIVSPETTFPSYRKLRLPKGGCRSEIVRYADYVQMHAVCNFVSGLRNQPVIIDVGAHHGAYAIVIGKSVQKFGGRVIAVEPNPQSCDVLQRNIRLNKLEKTVICEQVAIADKAGHMKIELLGSESKITSAQTNNPYTIEVVTLELLLEKYAIDYVDLLIIDVEGVELPVLRGFPWQSVIVRKIFCELHPYAWKDFGYNGEDMSNFLADHNYHCFDMYFQEHKVFESEPYIGPTLFINE
jgi:FkbM family methyltransferase